jgi:hypothetical protein
MYVLFVLTLFLLMISLFLVVATSTTPGVQAFGSKVIPIVKILCVEVLYTQIGTRVLDLQSLIMN